MKKHQLHFKKAQLLSLFSVSLLILLYACQKQFLSERYSPQEKSQNTFKESAFAYLKANMDAVSFQQLDPTRIYYDMSEGKPIGMRIPAKDQPNQVLYFFVSADDKPIFNWVISSLIVAPGSGKLNGELLKYSADKKKVEEMVIQENRIVQNFQYRWKAGQSVFTTLRLDSKQGLNNYEKTDMLRTVEQGKIKTNSSGKPETLATGVNCPGCTLEGVIVISYPRGDGSAEYYAALYTYLMAVERDRQNAYFVSVGIPPLFWRIHYRQQYHKQYFANHTTLPR